MDELDLILEDTFFEAHIVLDVRRKLVPLVVCQDGKEVILRLTKSHMARGAKLNLVSMDQM